MSKPTGGRGKKAPYETVVKRVPAPIESQVDKLIDEYREYVVNGTKLQSDHTSPKLEFAVENAKQILKSKKSAKQSLEKLLQVLYGIEINLKD